MFIRIENEVGEIMLVNIDEIALYNVNDRFLCLRHAQSQILTERSGRDVEKMLMNHQVELIL